MEFPRKHFAGINLIKPACLSPSTLDETGILKVFS